MRHQTSRVSFGSAKGTSPVSPRGTPARVAALVLGAWLASCGGEGDPAVAPTSADSQDIHQAFDVTITLPGGTLVTRLGAAAKESVKAEDRVTVERTLASTTSDVHVGTHAKVSDITAAHNVSIGHRSTADGDVRAGGFVFARGATITGSTENRANLGAPNVVTWSVPAATTNAGPVMVERDGFADLDPGTYGELRLRPGASVALRTGVYRFEKLSLDDTSTIVVNSRVGPVQIYTERDFTFRGSVETATIGTPQLLIAKIGHGHVIVEGEFTGALVAPDARVSVKASAQPHHRGHHHGRGSRHRGHHPGDDEVAPAEHRALVYGKTVFIAPGAVLRSYRFDWGGIGPGIEPPDRPDMPDYDLPPAPTETPVVVNPDGTGSGPVTSTPGAPIKFKLPQRYPVSGGIIGTGHAIFSFLTPAGQNVTCTYRGGSTGSPPFDEDQLNLGRSLHFESCTDGQPPSTEREATRTTLEVVPTPGYPVTVNAPVILDLACSEVFELLTPEQTTQMRRSFDWFADEFLVAETSGGEPAVYYAWVLIRNKTELLSLRRLFIHVLKRPLFQEELQRFAGRCGTFDNPGDGTGIFVPVLIPGVTYNLLKRLVFPPPFGPAIAGDRDIFEAIILRNDEVPAAARNPNGSVNLQVLAESGFRWLDYEPRPLPNHASIELESAGVSKALSDAFEWSAQAVRDVTEFVTNRIADLDRLFRGESEITLHLRSVTRDAAFGSEADAYTMIRGWGPSRGDPLGAPGLQVTILQKFLDSPLPETSQANTTKTGLVTVHAVDAGSDSIRGTGLCVELGTDSAIVTTGLIANELCDLRELDDDSPQSGKLIQLAHAGDQDIRLRIWNTRLAGLYQADDAFQYAKDVVDHEPRRARILTGYFADTFTRTNDAGKHRLYAPCLNFENTVSDTLLGAAAASGILAGAIGGGPVGAVVVTAFGNAIANTDIMMPTNSSLPQSRLVMSHEYGHYLFCSMLHAENDDAVDHIVWSTIGLGDDQSVPLRYINEAFADFFAGQVAGGADYGWLPEDNSHAVEGSNARYCIPKSDASGRKPCFDLNLRDSAVSEKGDESIGRIVTLLHDAFDGRTRELTSNTPGDADNWTNLTPAGTPTPNGRLILEPVGYGNIDGSFERVALPASSLVRIAEEMAQGLGPFGTGSSFSSEKMYRSVGRAMASEGYNWCERCRVLALHSPGLLSRDDATIMSDLPKLFEHCVFDALVSEALEGGEPDLYGRMDAETCTACPAGQIADKTGVCVPCGFTVHQNSCDVCVADVVLDGSTMALSSQVFDTTFAAPGDLCPEFFWVELRNPQAIFSRGGSLSATVAPEPLSAQACEQPFALSIALDTGGAFVIQQVLEGVGNFGGSPLPVCGGLPIRTFSAPEVATGAALRFGMPGDASKRVVINTLPPVDPP